MEKEIRDFRTVHSGLKIEELSKRMEKNSKIVSEEISEFRQKYHDSLQRDKKNQAMIAELSGHFV